MQIVLPPGKINEIASTLDLFLNGVSDFVLSAEKEFVYSFLRGFKRYDLDIKTNCLIKDIFLR